MDSNRVIFISFPSLVEVRDKGYTDLTIRPSVLNTMRDCDMLCRVVILHNQTKPSTIAYEAAKRAVVAFVVTYLGIAADIYSEGTDSEFRLPNVKMLEEAAMRFSALLGGKDCWLYVGNSETDKETAENFGIKYVPLEKFTNNEVSCD